MRKFRVKVFLVTILFISLAMGSVVSIDSSAVKVTSRYQIRVDLTENLIFIDEWDDNAGEFVPTEHVFLCSPGKSPARTPTGVFRANPLSADREYDPYGTGEWMRFRYWPSCYVNSATQITGSIIFHSVPSSKPNYAYVSQRDIDMMGSQDSHGCVRLWPRQAAWIRANCAGATIRIYYGPGHDNRLWSLREQLKQETPPKEIWPNTVVTENTKYIYTYYGDTLESLTELAGISVETLLELNPDMQLEGGIRTGLAVRIK